MRREDFDSSVALPGGLTIAAIRNATEYIERELVGLVDIYMSNPTFSVGSSASTGRGRLMRPAYTRSTVTGTSPLNDFPIFAVEGVPTRPHLKTRLNRRQAFAHGRYRPITTTLAGTSSGAIWLIQRDRMNRTARSSFGA